MKSRIYSLMLLFVASLTSFGCGGGSNPAPGTPAPTRLSVSGVVGASNGIFDPSPRNDGTSKLWMSFSTVEPSANDANLTEVRTRIASSTDGGATWADAGVDPNNNSAPDFQIPSMGNAWASWHYEVSSLLYDPYDADANRRWKMLWHRMLYVSIGGASVPSPENSWIGLSTAAAPDGTWSAERKLFAGSGYTPASADAFIGPPEMQLDALHSALNGCAAFTETSMLAKQDGIYVSLQCAGASGKIVGVKCDRSFSTCTYLGDFLNSSEAAQFSQGSQALNGFAASELVTVGNSDYLIVTPYEPPTDIYRGCLVFRISDLSTATLVRGSGVPTLVKRLSGSSGSFNGACGHDPTATGSGIIYSEYDGSSAPNFRMFASHITLP